MSTICKAIILILLCATISSPETSLAAFSGKYYTEEDIVIPSRYVHATPFSHGFAVVSEKSIGSGEYYFITPEGAWAFTKKRFLGKAQNIVFQEAMPFTEGLAVVRVGYKFGYINTQGEMVIEPQFDKAFPFEKGKALVSLGSPGPWFFIDASGKKLAALGTYSDKPHFRYNPRFQPYGIPVFIDGRACFEQEDPNSPGQTKKLYGYMDELGEVIIPPTYRKADAFSEGLAPVQLDMEPSDGQWTFIKPDGSIAMERRFYHIRSGFKNGLAHVMVKKTDSATGEEYINRQGETVLVVPREAGLFTYETNLDGNNLRGQVFRYGDTFELSLCLTDRTCGVQDMRGNWLIEPNLPGMIDDFHDGLAVFTVGHRVVGRHRAGSSVGWEQSGAGVVNRKGEIIVDIGKYREIGSYVHGLARVPDATYKNLLVYIDINGNIVENPLLPVGEPSEGLQLVFDENGRYGFARAQ